ncbi:polysaccharide pyruvyl transferase family protein [Modestobacter versicolor]|uniref:Polysaccharide pyruvyl transferase WcaK-like protein n=1 Tax=Modestobacter versicolor TaxID=429133 RepID=A0A323VE63_9ACTN|nr:polysaccharide pyruvyl transferase family protein [Modestobacter versicolor]MBB3676977.1 polysaccharide pyruvyl transferase WcaK-like protein [Modestobacter versicolor]PZA22891.1 hypothetical protein DMO24_02830 [Modestobacter versicolor]
MKQLVSRLARVGRRAVVASGVPARTDRLVVSRNARGAARAPGAGTHLVLAAPGGGNIGDQALLEALLENTAGPVSLVVPDAAQVQLPAEFADRVELLVIPHLVYGTGRAHLAAVARFGRALASATDLSVVGADVMDGRYSLPASVRRSTLATAAARAGVPTRVVGFSWSDRARPTARRALARAGRSGVRLLLRDPLSAERARRDGIAPVEEVADVVFAARSVDRSAADELLAGVTGPVALVNASGLLAGRLDQTEDYVRIVEGLRQRGLHVVLLPHVSRRPGDDVTACAAVAARVGTDRVSQVHRLLTPAQVRGLTERAAVTVTGRMHLAVMSLLNGVPAITLATQGKVEGLVQLFAAPELCVDPRAGFAATVLDVVDRVLPEGSDVRTSIRAALPRVVELARRNVDGLPAVELSRGAA